MYHSFLITDSFLYMKIVSVIHSPTLFIIEPKNQAYTHLICAAQNMKNISIKRASIDAKPYIFTKIIKIFTKLIKISKNHVKENLTFFQMWGLSTI